MNSLLVFIPDTLPQLSSGHIIGHINTDSRYKSCYVYGIEAIEESESSLLPDDYIGHFCNTLKTCLALNSRKYEKNNWIVLTCKKDILVDSVTLNGIKYSSKHCLMIIYNFESLLKSELILFERNHVGDDHFKLLAYQLKRRTEPNSSLFFKFAEPVLHVFISVVDYVNYILLKLSIICEYSMLATHFHNYCQNVLWMLTTYRDSKRLNLKTGNCLTSVIADLCFGFLTLYFITKWKNPDEIFSLISSCMINVIDCIKDLVLWLMGSPAGLKLNTPLNNTLGSLVLYYIGLWSTFLKLVSPVLEIGFLFFFKIGLLGLTFQLAIFTDIFAIVTFHMYCIYIYAAKLFEVQAKGIKSLSCLFIGRKRNPEPGKVDSCPYTQEELLIGTISFAVLLFLLPTTLVYYVVFTVMRLGVVMTRGMMIRTMYLVQALPIYVTCAWMFVPCYTTMTMKLNPPNYVISNSKPKALFAEPAVSSWFEAVKLCVPEVLSRPPPLQTGEILKSVFIGKIF